MDLSSLKFSKTHEWVKVDGHVATIGISDFAVKALTDLVYIDLPAVGRTLRASETFGVVESVKAASDLYSPVSGKVVAVNDKLANDLSKLSDDAFGTGWLIQVELANPAELSSLLDLREYTDQCAREAH